MIQSKNEFHIRKSIQGIGNELIDGKGMEGTTIIVTIHASAIKIEKSSAYIKMKHGEMYSAPGIELYAFFFGVSDEFNRPNSIRMARISRFTISNFAEGYVHDVEG